MPKMAIDCRVGDPNVFVNVFFLVIGGFRWKKQFLFEHKRNQAAYLAW